MSELTKDEVNVTLLDRVKELEGELAATQEFLTELSESLAASQEAFVRSQTELGISTYPSLAEEALRNERVEHSLTATHLARLTIAHEEFERLARRYATIGHAPSCLQVTAVGDCVCGYADLMVALGVERPDGVEHVSEDARRLAELERLAREVVDAEHLRAHSPGDGIITRPHLVGCINALAAFLQPTPDPKHFIDPTATWPLCATCGKSAREGRHCTELGEGHDYVPGQTKKRMWRIESKYAGEPNWAPVTDVTARVKTQTAEEAVSIYRRFSPDAASDPGRVYRAVEVKGGT